jgi:transcriptional regulator with XRE-family HTH domain
VATLAALAGNGGGVPKNAISDDDWRRFSGEISQLIHRARTQQGLTQEHVAYTAGITRTTYQRLEKNENREGSTANPGIRTMLAIATVLGLELKDLLPAWKPDLHP